MFADNKAAIKLSISVSIRGISRPCEPINKNELQKLEARGIRCCRNSQALFSPLLKCLLKYETNLVERYSWQNKLNFRSVKVLVHDFVERPNFEKGLQICNVQITVETFGFQYVQACMDSYTQRRLWPSMRTAPIIHFYSTWNRLGQSCENSSLSVLHVMSVECTHPTNTYLFTSLVWWESVRQLHQIKRIKPITCYYHNVCCK